MEKVLSLNRKRVEKKCTNSDFTGGYFYIGETIYELELEDVNNKDNVVNIDDRVQE